MIKKCKGVITCMYVLGVQNLKKCIALEVNWGHC